MAYQYRRQRGKHREVNKAKGKTKKFNRKSQHFSSEKSLKSFLSW